MEKLSAIIKKNMHQWRVLAALGGITLATGLLATQSTPLAFVFFVIAAIALVTLVRPWLVVASALVATMLIPDGAGMLPYTTFDVLGFSVYLTELLVAGLYVGAVFYAVHTRHTMPNNRTNMRTLLVASGVLGLFFIAVGLASATGIGNFLGLSRALQDVRALFLYPALLLPLLFAATEKNWRTVVRTMIVSGIIGGLAFVVFYLLYQTGLLHGIFQFGADSPFVAPRVNFRNVNGLVLPLALLWLFPRVFSARMQHVLILVSVFTLVGAMLLGQTRTVWLVLVALGIVLMYQRWRANRFGEIGQMLLVVCAVVLLAFAALLFIPNTHVVQGLADRVASVQDLFTGSDSSLSFRQDVNHQVAARIAGYPVIGHGFGSLVSIDYAGETSALFSIDNTVLTLAYKSGWFGLGTFVLLWCSVMFSLLRDVFPRNRTIALLFGGLLVVLAWLAWTSNLLLLYQWIFGIALVFGFVYTPEVFPRKQARTNRVIFVSDESLTADVIHSQGIPHGLALAKDGWHYMFLTPETSATQSAAQQKATDTGITKQWLSVDRPNGMPTSMALALFGFPIVAARNYRQPVLLHVRSFRSLPLAILCKLFLGVPYLYDTRGSYRHELAVVASFPRRVVATLYSRPIEYIGLHWADATTVVAEAYRTYLIKKYPAIASRVYTITNAVDTAAAHAARTQRTATRKKLGWDGAYIVLYMGTLQEWYDVGVLLQMYRAIHRAVPTARLVVATNDATIPDVLQRFAAVGGVEIIHVPSAERWNYLSAADCGLLPTRAHRSRTYSAPIKFAEYLAAGLPVVATPVITSVNTVINEDRVGHLFTKEQALTEWMREYSLVYTPLRSEQSAATHFAFAPVVAQYNDVLRSL